jgi:hypothetical protein
MAIAWPCTSEMQLPQKRKYSFQETKKKDMAKEKARQRKQERDRRGNKR